MKVKMKMDGSVHEVLEVGTDTIKTKGEVRKIKAYKVEANPEELVDYQHPRYVWLSEDVVEVVEEEIN